MSNLYQDALIDAKALRSTALANAKAALQEAFEPKIQEMLRLKLSENLEEDSLEEEVTDDAITQGQDAVDNADINEAELEEILAELEELSSQEEGYEFEEDVDQTLSEAKEDEEEADEESEEEVDDDVEDYEDAEEHNVDDDTKVIDITIGDLKEVLRSVMGGQQDMEMSSDEEPTDSDITLDEILAELEEEYDMEEGAEELGRYNAALVQSSDTQADAQGFRGRKIFEKSKGAYSQKVSAKGEKVDARNGGDENDTPYTKKGLKATADQVDDAYSKKVGKVHEELNEAKDTIESLRQDLQEVNLLNAKYLYMNKLFKSKNLNESQKVKVVKALDRATNVVEVKNTYETLKESFEAKTQLKESYGFASQAAGIAPKQPIIESDNIMSRWQKLAGIKK